MVLLSIVLACFVFSSVVLAETFVNDGEFHQTNGGNGLSGEIVEYTIPSEVGEEVEISYDYIYLANSNGRESIVYAKINGVEVSKNKFQKPHVCTDVTCIDDSTVDKTHRYDKYRYSTKSFVTEIPNYIEGEDNTLTFRYSNGDYRIAVTNVVAKTVGSDTECVTSEPIVRDCENNSEGIAMITIYTCEGGEWISSGNECPVEEIEEDTRTCPEDMFVVITNGNVFYPGDDISVEIVAPGIEKEYVSLAIIGPNGKMTPVESEIINGWDLIDFGVDSIYPVGDYQVIPSLNGDCQPNVIPDSFVVREKYVCPAQIGIDFDRSHYYTGNDIVISIWAIDEYGRGIDYYELGTSLVVSGNILSSGSYTTLDRDGRYTSTMSTNDMPEEYYGNWEVSVSTRDSCPYLEDIETVIVEKAGIVEPVECYDNEKRCTGIDLQICEDNNWRTIQVCGGFCDSNELKCSGQTGQAQICTDSDGGSMFDIKGITYGRDRYNGDYVTREDSCSQSTLVEYFCVGYDVYDTTSFCEYGCKEGACVSAQEELTRDAKTSIQRVDEWVDWATGRFSGAIKAFTTWVDNTFGETNFTPPFEEAIDEVEVVNIDSSNIIMYGTTTCPFCKNMITYLEDKGVEFQVFYIDENEAAMQEMMRLNERGSVPTTLINGRVVVGYNTDKVDDLLGKMPIDESLLNCGNGICTEGESAIGCPSDC